MVFFDAGPAGMPAPHSLPHWRRLNVQSLTVPRRSLQRLTGFVLVVSMFACTVYAPAGRPARDGQDVQAFLNDFGRSQLGQAVGAGTRTVTGAVAAVGDSSLTVAVIATRSIDGADHEWTGEHVTLPLAMLDSVRVQRISVVRSALFAGALVAAVALIRAAFSGGGSGGTQRSPGPAPQ